jgi:hypothetical protein
VIKVYRHANLFEPELAVIFFQKGGLYSPGTTLEQNDPHDPDESENETVAAGAHCSPKRIQALAVVPEVFADEA